MGCFDSSSSSSTASSFSSSSLLNWISADADFTAFFFPFEPRGFELAFLPFLDLDGEAELSPSVSLLRSSPLAEPEADDDELEAVSATPSSYTISAQSSSRFRFVGSSTSPFLISCPPALLLPEPPLLPSPVVLVLSLPSLSFPPSSPPLPFRPCPHR